MATIAQQLKVTEFPFTIYDKKGNEIYFENSKNYWVKREFDQKGNQIYFESSEGIIEDDRNIPEYTMEELTKLVGEEFKIKK